MHGPDIQYSARKKRDEIYPSSAANLSISISIYRHNMTLFSKPHSQLLGAAVALVMLGTAHRALAQQRATPRPDSPQIATSQQIVTLEGVLEQAQANNETWAITEARITQAHGARRQALAALLPSLAADASVTRNGNAIDFGGSQVQRQYNWGVSGRASIAIFDGTKYPLLSRSGKLLEASQALAQWQRGALAFEVTQAFYLLAAAQSRVAIAEHTVELRQAQLERSQALLDAKLGVKLDTELARTQVLEAQQDLLEARSLLGNAADSLGVLLVVEPAIELRTDLSTTELTGDAANPPAQVDIASLDTRGDLQATQLQIEAVELNKTSVWASFLPVVELGANANLGPSSAFSNPNGFDWSLTLSASWLLYDGGYRYGQLEQLSGQITEASLEYERELRQAGAGVRQALRAWRTATASVDVAQQQVRAAEQSYASVQARFENGLNTSLDVANASESLFEAEVSLNQRIFDARTAAAEYHYLLGLMGQNQE